MRQAEVGPKTKTWNALLGLTTIVASTAFTACGALDEFEETVTDEVLIPMNRPGLEPFEANYAGNLGSVDLSRTTGFQENGLTPSDVDAIFVKAIRLEMIIEGATDPRLIRLDQLFESVDFYVEATGNPRRSLGMLSTFPSAGTVDLPVDTTLNLKSFATSPGMKFGATVNLKPMRTFNVTLKTSVTLLVDINLLGV